MRPYWQDESRGLTLYHGDCADVFLQFRADEFGSVITDPPYGVGIADWDIPPTKEILRECLRVAEGTVVMFGGAPQRSQDAFRLLGWDRMMVWHPRLSWAKRRTNGMTWKWHPIYLWRPINQGVFYCDVALHNLTDPRMPRMSIHAHPARKPESLIGDLVTAFGSRSVLDPYAGSGTTGAACAKLGIPCTMIEIDEGYCEMIVARLTDDVTYGKEANLFSRVEEAIS